MKRGIGSAICAFHLGRYVQSVHPFMVAVVPPPPQCPTWTSDTLLLFRKVDRDWCVVQTISGFGKPAMLTAGRQETDRIDDAVRHRREYALTPQARTAVVLA